jgi:asparagine synthase (glutamine-hydrolysing)
MCGILGYIGFETLKNDERIRTIRRMGHAQWHRGPDGWGEWIQGPAVLGHNRLAVLDIEGGVQPFLDSTKSVGLVFNGEIYNARQLRKDLESHGLLFQTDHSDTEVILNGYLHWGESVVDHLYGMFAFAIWDGRKKRLFMARDRMGIKPFYYICSSQGFAFASEPKTLIAGGLIKPEINHGQISSYFHFRSAQGIETLFKGIFRLFSGESGFWEPGMARPQTGYYWNPEVGREIYRNDELVSRFDTLFDTVVNDHLVSDVPVGIYLSGGVDSSLVTLYTTRHQTLNCYTVGTDSAWDETSDAARVSKLTVSPFFPLQMNQNDFSLEFEPWSYFNDDPVADPSALALYIISRHARANGMTVMLSGEGGDEVFGGYNSYIRYAAYTSLRFILNPLYKITHGVCPNIFQWDPRLQDYLEMNEEEFLGTAHVTSLSLRRRLLHGDPHVWQRHPEILMRINSIVNSATTPLRRAMLIDQITRLPDEILTRTDRATMAVSIEARVPFLDHRVVDYGNSLPDNMTMHLLRREGKPFLKMMAAKSFPRRFIYRPKCGFDLPIDVWLKGVFRNKIEGFLSECAIDSINYAEARSLFNGLLKGNNKYLSACWSILTLEQWYRNFIKNRAIHPGSYEQLKCPAILTDESSITR